MAATAQAVPKLTRGQSIAVVSSFKEKAWIRWLMLLSDAAAIEISLLLGVATRQALSSFFPETTITAEQFRGAAFGLLLLPLVNLFLEMYPGYCLNPVERMRRRVYSTIGVVGALIVWDYLVPSTIWSRGILLSTLLFALAIPPIFEVWLRKLLVHRKVWGSRVVVLGASAEGRSLIQTLKNQPEMGMVPIAVLDDDPATWTTEIEGVPVVGPIRKSRAFSSSAEIAAITVPNLPRLRLLEWLKDLPFARVIVIPDLSGLQTQGVRTLDFSGSLGLEVRKNLLVPRNRFLKRATDFCLTIPLFLLALPIIAILALCVKCSSRGPAFYSQKRMGKNGRPLHVLKLRTMRVNAEELLERHLNEHPEDREQWLHYFKLKRDPRIIPWIGTFLRRSSLDELPQLFNILRGEMSLVGPRPFPEYHLAQFPREFREFRNRVLPGLTGLWQVSERSNGNLSVQERLDTYYIRNWSVWLDIYLLTRTVRAVIAGTGAQ